MGNAQIAWVAQLNERRNHDVLYPLQLFETKRKAFGNTEHRLDSLHVLHRGLFPINSLYIGACKA